MDIIYNLVRKLALLSIFAAFCELLLPRGNFRTYSRMVVGLLVIAMILQPLLELRGQSFNLEDILAAASLNAGLERQAFPWVREQSKDLLETQLAELAREFLAPTYPGYEVEVALDLAFDEYGNLTEYRAMEVSLRPGARGIEPIAPVVVGTGQAERWVAAPEGVGKALARHLGIPAETLSIWVYTGGGEANGQ
jgi:stage III sporulation protein AF